jgi:cytidine deaminase
MDNKQREQIIAGALAVRLRAYAPYSKYLVGAAVLTQSGQVFTGCNVENASYGLTICAERSAIFQAVAADSMKLTAIAVAATEKVTPCGACLQVMAEFSEDLLIFLVDPSNPSVVTQRTLNELLPHRFSLEVRG